MKSSSTYKKLRISSTGGEVTGLRSEVGEVENADKAGQAHGWPIEVESARVGFVGSDFSLTRE